jgi:hypothetical protein
LECDALLLAVDVLRLLVCDFFSAAVCAATLSVSAQISPATVTIRKNEVPKKS